MAARRLPKLGTGARFRRLVKKIGARKGVRDPGAVAASIGREKFGKKRFQRLAARGLRRVAPYKRD